MAETHRLLTLDGHLTDANAAIFGAAHGFRGCIPGIHEVLRRQGPHPRAGVGAVRA